MGLADLPRITKELNTKELSNILAMIIQELDFVVNGNIKVKNIRAKGVKADRLDVDELSAISANLGVILAGIIRGIQIFGSYIATAEGTYPRSEMDVAGAFFAALKDASTFVKIDPAAGNVAVKFAAPLLNALIQLNDIFASELIIYSSYDIRLAPDGLGAGRVKIPSWARLYSEGGTETLQDVFDAISSDISSKAPLFTGYTGSFTVDGTTLLYSNGILTSVSP